MGASFRSMINAALYPATMYASSLLIHPPRRRSAYWTSRLPSVTPADAGMPFEEWKIQTRDGLAINAWFIPAMVPARGTIIYLHGIGGSRVTTISGSATFVKEGYNVLAYDSRGCGDSEGDCCTYGFYEKFDLVDAVEFLLNSNRVDGDKIAALGKSMGGAVALQSLAVGANLRCVISEASFADLHSIVCDYQRRKFGRMAAYIEQPSLRRSEMKAHFVVDSVSPRTSVRDTKTPLMIIHGADDPLVNARYAQLIYDEASGEKELWIVPRGGHTDLRSVVGEEYDLRRLRFLEQHGM